MCKDLQPAFLGKNVFARFMNGKFTNINRIESVENSNSVLLVFDYWCEDSYNDKAFVKLPAACRDRKTDELFLGKICVNKFDSRVRLI